MVADQYGRQVREAGGIPLLVSLLQRWVLDGPHLSVLDPTERDLMEYCRPGSALCTFYCMLIGCSNDALAP